MTDTVTLIYKSPVKFQSKLHCRLLVEDSGFWCALAPQRRFVARYVRRRLGLGVAKALSIATELGPNRAAYALMLYMIQASIVATRQCSIPVRTLLKEDNETNIIVETVYNYSY